MNDTYLETNSSKDKNRAKGYTNRSDTLKEELQLNSSQYWAAGGIVSTKNDLINYDKSLLSGEVLAKNEIEKKSASIVRLSH